MDGERFDSLTRTLTAPLSRRVTLSGLAAGLLLSLGLALDKTTVLAKGKGKDKRKKKACPKGKPERCGDRCCKTSQACKKGKCLNHCDDGQTNFGETGKDCGGTCRDIRKCASGEGCATNADCASNACAVAPGASVLTCQDCTSDRDCSSPAFPRCLDNECNQCADDSDCPGPDRAASKQFCVGLDFDDQQGPGVAPCTGANLPCVCRECRANADCDPEMGCNVNGDCVPIDTCTNEVKDGDETDVNCGGSCPTKCALGKGCRGNADCQSGVCGSTGTCAECASDSDCPVVKFCNSTGTCVARQQCGEDSECSGGFCLDCCVGCSDGSHCYAGSVCP